MACFRAIVFDVGGTLICPARPVGETYALFASPHGVKLDSEATMVAFRQAMKTLSPRVKGTIPTNGDDRLWWKEVVRHSVSDRGFLESPQFETFFEEVYLHFAKPEAWEIFPEVLEVFQALRDYPVDLVALSNWDGRLHGILDGLGLISTELGWEKPDPAIYRHVAELLHLLPDSLLSVGDDPCNDVEAARKAGWEAVLVERPKTDLWVTVKALRGGGKKIGSR
jgi:putative hydrolase of the HAD superfamily